MKQMTSKELANEFTAVDPLATEALNGFWPVKKDFSMGWGKRNQDTPAKRRHEAQVAEGFRFMVDVMNGDTPFWALLEALRPSGPEAQKVIRENYPLLFTESMTISDFPLLTGDVLDRMLLARFQTLPAVWRQYIPVRSRPLRDFRTVRNIKTDGGSAYWDKLTEKDGLKYVALDETGYTYSPSLYGKGARLSFQQILNDDLGAFDFIPQILGEGGAGTLWKFAVGLLLDASGPHASLYTAGNGNIITGSPALSVTSLGTAIQQIAGLTNSDGLPIGLTGLRLVYGTSLHVTAQNILNQLSVDITEAGGTTARTVRVNNWLVQGLTPVMDPMIDQVATGALGTWLLVQDPNVGRPVAEVGFLNGFQNPTLFRKAGNTAALTGGVNQMMGDWQTMSQEYKGAIGYGGTQQEPLVTVGSDGTG